MQGTGASSKMKTFVKICLQETQTSDFPSFTLFVQSQDSIITDFLSEFYREHPDLFHNKQDFLNKISAVYDNLLQNLR